MRGFKVRKNVKVKSGNGKKKTVTKNTRSGTVNVATGSKGSKLKSEIKAGKKKVRKINKTQKQKARKTGGSTKGKMKPTYFKG